jgi:hypothetical protein
MKSLESRLLLSTTIPQRDSITWFPNPPRTGGIALQSGSVLSCLVGRPKGNVVQVTDDGKGDVQMSWNFGQPHAFTGVAMEIIQAERARTDQFTFTLSHGDTVTAAVAAAGSTFHQAGPSTASTGIELGPHRPADSVSANGGSHPLAIALRARTSGSAVQSGSLLTVTVNRPRTNIVQITEVGAGNVAVAWNGGAAHSFTGVTTIIVNARHARKDQVTLTHSAL